MEHFFTLTFWFDLRPGHLTSFYQNILTGLISFLIVFGIISFLTKRNKKSIYFKVWDRLFTFCATNLFIGLILWFTSYELVPFFSSRFWYLFWIIGMATWIVFIIRHLKTIPEQKKKITESQKYNKYLP